MDRKYFCITVAGKKLAGYFSRSKLQHWGPIFEDTRKTLSSIPRELPCTRLFQVFFNLSSVLRNMEYSSLGTLLLYFPAFDSSCVRGVRSNLKSVGNFPPRGRNLPTIGGDFAACKCTVFGPGSFAISAILPTIMARSAKSYVRLRKFAGKVATRQGNEFFSWWITDLQTRTVKSSLRFIFHPDDFNILLQYIDVSKIPSIVG